MPVKRLCGICFISLLYLLSCGLEESYYIDYIPDSVMQTTTRATIRLPSPSSDNGYSNYFNNFIIFYRIYASDIWEEALIASTTTNDLYNKSINAALTSDYGSLYNYTNKLSTTVSTSNLENVFSNRKYFMLTLKNAEIDKVLDSGSLGDTLEIVFSPVNGEEPRLTLNGGTPYFLQRDKKGLSDKEPSPDLSFFNHADLYSAANATSMKNADVASTTANLDAFGYTYVSMYIAAIGKNTELPPKEIYSQPTFIGIFRLANP